MTKEITPWMWLGICGPVLVGVLGLIVGLSAGQDLPGGMSSGRVVSQYSSGKDRFDKLVIRLGEAASSASPMDTRTGNHRIFVSRTLVFLPHEQEPVQPLQTNQIGTDGIAVGWKIQYGFDLEDPDIAGQDDDSDGFTNLEEFEKGTNPLDKNSSPSKWIKLKVASVENVFLTIRYTGGTDDSFTLQLSTTGKRREFNAKLGDHFWVAVTASSVEVFTSEQFCKTLQENGSCPHAIPMKIVSFHKDKGTKFDNKTKTPIDYNDSYLEISREDQVRSNYKVYIETPGGSSSSRGLQWHVGNVRFISLVPGEGEFGPFRVGQSFNYAGREFAILNAVSGKVNLKLLPDGEEVLVIPKTP